MLEAVASVFPKRALTLKDKTGNFFGTALLFVISVVMGAGICAMVWTSLLPGIRHDWVISQDAEPFDPAQGFAAPFRSASTIRGECKAFGGVLEDCDVSVSFRDSKGNARTQRIEMAFLDLTFSDYDVTAVRSASNPDMVSIDLAVDKLWNRIFTAGILALFGVLALTVGPLTCVKSRKMRAKVRAMSGRALTPVTAEVVSVTSQYGQNNVVYSVQTPSGAKKFTAAFGKQLPFALRPESKEALGLKAAGDDFVFLLDEALTRLDLTDDERQRIWRARDGEQAGAQA